VIHRDLKPGNIFLCDDGTPKVLDFGMSKLTTAESLTQAGYTLGTPEYMAPEQVASESITEATDWYSVGALLYRALTGNAAFEGKFPHVLYEKLQREATAPSEILPGLPDDLNTLCRDLLRRDPARRPSGAEVLARLGSAPAPIALTDTAIARPSTFVGREAQLGELRAAYERMKQGRAATVHVHGRSGMGKTALVRHFLGHVRQRDREVVVLEGRCYEHEAVPFKAFDSVLDALSNHLRRLPVSTSTRLLPRGIDVLARVFPALRRVDAIADAHERTPSGNDPQELRRRAFAALREFFGRVAEHAPLIVFIDDLQWGDVDSAALLDELLRPPDAPPLLLVMSYRDDDIESSACLQALLSAAQMRGAGSMSDVEVAALAPDDAEGLARALRPRTISEAQASAIAREAQGSPFFIDELVRYGTDRGGAVETLDTVLWNRALQLPPLARRFMEVVAVAGRPVDISVVAQASSVDTGKFDVFASLRAARLVRSRAGDDGTEVESYHDRIRETVVAHLTPAVLAQHHLQLAAALRVSRSPDEEAMALHYHAGGDLKNAAVHAVAAAQKSVEALAFDGAARLYRLALECGIGGSHDAALRIMLGKVLALAGRVRESADAYLSALDGVTPSERIDLRRRAGEQYLLGGYVDEGLGLLQSTLADMGITLPSTPRRAFVSLVLRQIYTRIRGLGFRERAEKDIPAFELQRLDMCHAVCRGLGFTDSVRAIELQTRHLLLALDAGEPYRIARALTFSATADGLRARTRPRAEHLIQVASKLAAQVNNPHALGLVQSTSGFVHLAAGRWRQAYESLDRAEKIMRDEVVGDTMPYEIVLCYVYKLEALFLEGTLDEYFRNVPLYLAECQGRGDIFAEASLRLRNVHRVCLELDDPDAADEELRLAASAWGKEKHYISRANHLFRQVELAQYRGDFSRAWTRISQQWDLLAPLRLFGFQSMTSMAFERRAQAALGMAAIASERKESAVDLLRSAERDAAHLDRWKMPWGAAAAQLVRAGIAAHRQQYDRAVEHLTAAENGFAREAMALHLAVTRWRKGALIGGEEGRMLVTNAREWMQHQGIRDADRTLDVFAPGVWSRP